MQELITLFAANGIAQNSLSRMHVLISNVIGMIII
jgi:hypothetical protein